MRISDWSSDVCSSDLRCAVGAGLTVAHFRTAISRAEVTEEGVLRGYAAVYDQPTNRQADYAGTETIARGAFDGVLGGADVLGQIGRASCRESVCQYV